MDTSSRTTPVTPDTCTASTSTSSSTTSSAPQYSDEMRRPLHNLDLLPRQGSGSSTKTCEVDLGDEERDTFSPVSSTNNSPQQEDRLHEHIMGNSSTSLLNGEPSCSTTSSTCKDYKQPFGDMHGAGSPLKLKIVNSLSNNMLQQPAPSSKEEKQRQNEEIVILETSSISSETGSWDSVFPHAQNPAPSRPPVPVPQADVDLSNYCVGFLEKNLSLNASPGNKLKLSKEKEDTASSSSSITTLKHKELDLEPLARERTYSAGHNPMTADTSSLFKGVSSSSLHRELLNKSDNPLTSSQTSACFIDASSLCDEDEVPPYPKPAGGVGGVAGLSKQSKEMLEGEADDESPTKKLETFHKSFARCKVKSKEEMMPSPPASINNIATATTTIPSSNSNNRPMSSNSSCSSEENNDKQTESVSNLSDEEKLWKRDHKPPLVEDDNEGVKLLENHKNLLADDGTEASVSLAHDVDSSDSSELFRIKRENERKFPQYSGLPPVASKLLNTHGSMVNSGNGHHLHHHHHHQPSHSHNTANHSDVSYTTDYSSSSPAPSLQWSEHEHRPSHNQKLHIEEYDPMVAVVKAKCMLPDTPHNSIVHIEPNCSSNTSSIHRDYTLSSSSFSHHRDSGAYCSDATDSPIPMPRTPKRSKFDEANPIISGGSLISDFQVKPCESPSLKRKTDTCPIVSGGFTSLDFEHTQPIGDEDDDGEAVQIRNKSKARKPIPGIASWVVDMSDCQYGSERRRSTSSSSSLEISNSKFRERSDSNSSHKSGCGFYVSLDDMEKKPPKEKKPSSSSSIDSPQMSKSFNAPPPSARFFVNLSASEYKPKEQPRPLGAAEEIKPQTKGDEETTASANSSQKNLFSMFIDIGNGNDKKPTKPLRKEPFSLAQRLSTSLTTTQLKKSEEAPASMKSAASSTETLMSKSNQNRMTATAATASADSDAGNQGGESKSLDYKINFEPPITVAAIRRLSMQQKAQHEANKRHSWGNNSNAGTGIANGIPDYKRSISLTNNGDSKDSGKGLMSIIDKLPIISKTSSLSIDSSISPYDDYTGSKSELSTSSGGEREDHEHGLQNPHQTRIKKRRRDVQLNETFDKSSLASITDGILSKDLSPLSTTDTDDLTFQQDEEMAAREAEEAMAHLQTTQLPSQNIPTTSAGVVGSGISSTRMSNIIMETIVEAKETASPKKVAQNVSMDSLQATIEKQKMLLETVTEHAETTMTGNTFVKLSDMDKPVNLNLKSPERMCSSVGGGNNHRQINRLYRDDNSRANRPHSWTMSRSTGNSFQNFTNSVENLRSLSRLFPNFSKEISNSLPNDMTLDNLDYIQTDLSNDSSLASSISRSGMDESSISCRQPRRLGEDLLKMFLQEIATDMIVEVHGRRIKAHKCILRSRCQYFAAMLAGNQSSSVVSLQGYSYSAAHFALCHIYSGASHPPDGISLMELAALADLLGLEGLKEVTAHALKTNYCHNFHKPCSGCIDGTLQVLPVALNHALDDLYRKCLKWTCRHYMKVWPTRQFAQLPSDILGRCRQQIVANLTSESVLNTVLDFDNLLAQLATYRWGGVCENLVRNILDAAYGYIADHFASLIASDSFLSLGHDRSCQIPHLEGVLLRTASNLTPDQACRSYQRITRLNTVLQAKVIQMPAGLGELAKELQGLQEEDLDWDTEYIRLVSSILSAVEQCLIRQCSRAMRVTAWQRMDLDLRKKIQTLARLTEPLDLKRGKPVSKAFSFGGSTRNQDLQQVKAVIQAHSKRTLAQDTQLFKATQTTHDAVQTTERGVQANHDLREGTSRVLKSNSRAHVPQAFKGISQSAVTSERNSANVAAGTAAAASSSTAAATHHRRTKSEAPTTASHKSSEPKKHVEAKTTNDTEKKFKVHPIKLAEVRPRYLEPKKIHTATTNVHGLGNGPIRSSTSSSIPANLAKKQNYQQSSSESSRHSSPATRKHLNGKVATIKSTNNMSLDSLTSGNRTARCKTNKSSDNERFSDLCVDSMNESMKSSVITNKSASRESLLSNRLGRSTKLKSESLNAANGKGRTNGTIRPVRPTSLGPRAPKYLQQKVTSTGSSPSSVTTTKSATSRLSSVSSTQSSRDFYKRSISVPGQAVGENNQPPTKHSFLSAKSREILARRAEKEKNKQQQEQMKHSQPERLHKDEVTCKSNLSLSGGPVMRSASHSSVLSSNNRNNMPPSNIPTRRPNSLQLKKTHNKTNNSNSNNYRNHKSSSAALHTNSNEIYQTAQAVKQKIELLIKTSAAKKAIGSGNNVDDARPTIVVESKLERSSTFCKDAAEVADINELQIIE
uniref:BTB domain-containing protein n=1 Tax=Stomoxys calcitrans TaxID=35570 RepID=A0A1I8PDT7_STOCA